MATRYKVYRSADKNRHLILADSAFERVPAAIRDEGICVLTVMLAEEY